MIVINQRQNDDRAGMQHHFVGMRLTVGQFSRHSHDTKSPCLQQEFGFVARQLPDFYCLNFRGVIR